MPYSDYLALKKELLLKKTALNQTVFYGIEVKYQEFSTEKVLTTHKIFLC